MFQLFFGMIIILTFSDTAFSEGHTSKSLDKIDEIQSKITELESEKIKVEGELREVMSTQTRSSFFAFLKGMAMGGGVAALLVNELSPDYECAHSLERLLPAAGVGALIAGVPTLFLHEQPMQNEFTSASAELNSIERQLQTLRTQLIHLQHSASLQKKLQAMGGI